MRTVIIADSQIKAPMIMPIIVLADITSLLVQVLVASHNTAIMISGATEGMIWIL
jgi:hypothetical protein